MKKTFLLEQLELYLDENIYLQGDQLVEFDRVIRLEELEKHLWIGQIEGDGLYEIEIKISPSKVLAYTCECKQFAQEGLCAHIAAGLIKIRRKKRVAKQQRAAKPRKQSTPKKLTTNIILEQVNQEDLMAFVRQYARNNRSFAIALKARFASSVSSLDSKEKFSQLLESAINHNRKADRTISLRGSQKILKILVELQAQIEDSVAREHYSEAISIAQSVIEKMVPVLKKLSSNKEVITDFILEAFEVFLKIIKSKPAPALKESIWEYCLEESDKIVYRANQVDQYFFKIALQLVESKEQGALLLQTMEELTEKYKNENRGLSSILLVHINILEKIGSKKMVKQLIADNLDQPDVLLFAIHQAMEKKEFKRVKLLATEGLKLENLKADRYKLEQILLTVAQEQKDSRAIARFARIILLRTLDLKYYQLLKANSIKEWEPLRTSLIEKINKLPFSEKRRDIIALIYKEDNLQRELIDYLKRTQSIDLLMMFDEGLFGSYKKEIAELYRDLLHQYLNNYLGRKTSQRIRQCINHLVEIGQDRLGEELVEEFRSSFPERHTLMEELAYF